MWMELGLISSTSSMLCPHCNTGRHFNKNLNIEAIILKKKKKTWFKNYIFSKRKGWWDDEGVRTAKAKRSTEDAFPPSVILDRELWPVVLKSAVRGNRST